MFRSKLERIFSMFGACLLIFAMFAPRAVSQQQFAAGAVVKTMNYSPLAADSGKLFVMNCSSVCAVTLPNPPPTKVWTIWVESVGAGIVSVSPNGLTLNLASANMNLSNVGVVTRVTTDGSNYYANDPSFGGDVHSKGSNPNVDVTSYGARALNPNVSPATPGITASINSASSPRNATVSSASFVNGDGVLVFGAGATNAMSTPSAPTVTASVAQGPPGTGIVANAPNGGSTNYCYEIIAEDVGGGFTPASSPTCISNGSARLGTVSVSVKSSNRKLFTVSVKTSARSPEIISVGDWVHIFGTNNQASFDGWYNVASVPNNGTFTYISGNNTTYGAATSSTGGTAMIFSCNHVGLPAPGANVYRYHIYGRTRGAYNWLGLSRPVNGVGNSGSQDRTYYTWDDFGETMSGDALAPYWIPTTAPKSAGNDNLSTTVSGGGGTTSLTLTTPASHSVTNATILADDGPALVAAANQARSRGGMIYIPCTPNGADFVIQSLTDIASTTAIGLSQCGPLYLNGTVKASGLRWQGDLTSGDIGNPEFGAVPTTPIYVARANPGLMFESGVFLQGLNISAVAGANAYNSVFINGQDGNVVTGTMRDMAFGTLGGNNDYMGVPIYMIAGPTANNAGLNFTNMTMTPGPAQSFTTATPLVISKGFSEQTWLNLFLNVRGMYFSTASAGLLLDIASNTEREGGIMPMVTIFDSQAAYGNIHLKNFVQDTEQQPIVASIGTYGQLFMEFDLDNAGGVSGSPVFSGVPISHIVDNGANHNPNSEGQNHSVEFSTWTSAPSGKRNESQELSVNPGFSIFAEGTQPPAPTCATSAGGNVTVGNPVYTFVPVFPNGLEGVQSAGCAANVTTGNQTVNLSWSAVLGAIGYDVYVNNRLVKSTCVPPITTGTTWSDTYDYQCGAGPLGDRSGPAGIQNTWIWSVHSQLQPIAIGSLPSAATAGAGAMYVVKDSSSFRPGTCTAGGSDYMIAISNGSTWTCH